ncbi:MAG: hypothetical protein NTU80_08275 [Verrucomicrobia bacterium]|nr:hypothetical protein [Verrucomicrobiota bacterium]
MQSEALPFATAHFPHGNRWVRADFHLHTSADKKFRFNGDPNFFVSLWLDRLEAEQVEIAVVTNHNLFDLEEFDQLAKAGRKRGILVLPGVELSVNDGANGIHVLVIFDPSSWLKPGDSINPFLDAAFYGTSVRERTGENERCGWSLEKLLQEIHDQREKHGRDSFAVAAHVEQASGIFHPSGLGGGRIEQLGRNPLFAENLLGFQKVRTGDEIKKWRGWLGPSLPAFIEGSDPDEMAKVGQAHQVGGVEKRTYLHLGAFTFAAVKLALRHHEAHVATQPTKADFPHLLSLEVEGGVRLSWSLNSGLNTLIGIRGSGKSTILELLRYGLGLELKSEGNQKSADPTYIQKLLDTHLGSGGTIKIRLRNSAGDEYEVRRVFNQAPEVFTQGIRRDNLRPDSLLRVLYFGQKDLSQLGESSRNTDLLERFYGVELRECRAATQAAEGRARELVQRLTKQTDTLARRQSYLEQQAKLREELRLFEERKVGEKLQRQVTYNADLSNLQSIADWLGNIADGLSEARPGIEADLASWRRIASVENPQEIAEAVRLLDTVSESLRDLQTSEQRLRQAQAAIRSLRVMIETRRKSLDEEFAAVRRAIHHVSLDADSYVNLKRKLQAVELALAELEKENQRRETTRSALRDALHSLRECWHAEYTFLKGKTDELNTRKLPIRLKLGYRENKNAFARFLLSLVSGTSIREETVARLASEFVDGISLFEDMEQPAPRWKEIVTTPSSQVKLEERLRDSLADLVAYRVPDLLVLERNGVPLEKHSLGQRTSALLLFLLEKGDYDLLLIDQPEDDLDNQTIYADVILRLGEMKRKHQFIFATHNANIPVLGEAEMVGACAYEDGALSLDTGSTDAPEIQNKIIAVMEGGQRAFELRQSIYQQWTH